MVPGKDLKFQAHGLGYTVWGLGLGYKILGCRGLGFARLGLGVEGFRLRA